jgi:hypothetical protein
LRAEGGVEASGLRALSATDGEALLRLAQRLSVASLLYHRLQTGGTLPAMPEETQRVLREFYLATAARNMRLLRELGALLDTLREAHIPVIPLKGAVLLERYYGNLGLRALGDLDLLVPVSDVAAAVRALTGLGYDPDPRFDPAVAVPVTKHTRLGPGPGALALVEVHWDLTTPGAVEVPGCAELWDRAVPATVAGVAVSSLCPEDLLLHLCLHLAYEHDFAFGLRGFCDIALVAAACVGTLDWPAVVARAQRWQVDRAVYLALRLTRDWLAAPIPSAVLAALQPAAFDESVLCIARARVFTEPPAGRRLPTAFARMYQQPRLTAKLGAAVRRVFVDKQYLAARYGVSPRSPSIYFYYLPRLWGLLRRFLPLTARLRRDRQLQGHVQSLDALNRWLAGG